MYCVYDAFEVSSSCILQSNNGHKAHKNLVWTWSCKKKKSFCTAEGLETAISHCYLTLILYGLATVIRYVRNLWFLLQESIICSAAQVTGFNDSIWFYFLRSIFHFIPSYVVASHWWLTQLHHPVLLTAPQKGRGRKYDKRKLTGWDKDKEITLKVHNLKDEESQLKSPEKIPAMKDSGLITIIPYGITNHSSNEAESVYAVVLWLNNFMIQQFLNSIHTLTVIVWGKKLIFLCLFYCSP